MLAVAEFEVGELAAGGVGQERGEPVLNDELVDDGAVG
jgi:hypothetical protein